MKTMTDIHMFLAQIARARRFAAAMTNDVEKERFAIMAEELQDELEAIPEHLVSQRDTVRQ